MPEYSVVFARSARRELERLHEPLSSRILTRIESLGNVPRPTGCRKLEGSRNLWRIRLGDYRLRINNFVDYVCETSQKSRSSSKRRALAVNWSTASWRNAVLTVGASEARTHLAPLLKRVARGVRVTITKHGVPIAMLVPVESAQDRDKKALVKELERLRKGTLLGNPTIWRLMDKGRRS